MGTPGEATIGTLHNATSMTKDSQTASHDGKFADVCSDGVSQINQLPVAATVFLEVLIPTFSDITETVSMSCI